MFVSLDDRRRQRQRQRSAAPMCLSTQHSALAFRLLYMIARSGPRTLTGEIAVLEIPDRA